MKTVFVVKVDNTLIVIRRDQKMELTSLTIQEGEEPGEVIFGMRDKAKEFIEELVKELVENIESSIMIRMLITQNYVDQAVKLNLEKGNMGNESRIATIKTWVESNLKILA